MENKDFLLQGLRPWTCFFTCPGLSFPCALISINLLALRVSLIPLSYPPLASTWVYLALGACAISLLYLHRALSSSSFSVRFWDLLLLAQPCSTQNDISFLGIFLFNFLLCAQFVCLLDTGILSPFRIYVKAHRTVVPQFIYLSVICSWAPNRMSKIPTLKPWASEKMKFVAIF